MQKDTAHLTDAEVALYADAIIFNSLDRLPDKILFHVMECLRCKRELMELSALVEAEELRTFREPHPFFGRTIA